jgi:hypothetical protein
MALMVNIKVTLFRDVTPYNLEIRDQYLYLEELDRFFLEKLFAIFGLPVRKAERSNAWVCGAHLLELRVRFTPVHGYLSLVSVVCCHAEISATARSLVQRIATGCGVSECDRETSTVRRPWPARAVEP